MALSTLAAPDISQGSSIYSPESLGIKTLETNFLDRVLDSAVSCIQKFGKDAIFDPDTTKFYHEFSQTQAKLSFLIPYLDEYGIEAESLYLVLGHVGPSFLGSVHAHQFSDAICYILGEKEGFQNADGAYAVRCEEDWVAVSEDRSKSTEAAPDESWFPVHSGDKIYNLRTVAHSFCCRGKTGYSFICVQTPGIDNPNFDDWIPAQIKSRQPETDGLVKGLN
jgi:hypothetical protein